MPKGTFSYFTLKDLMLRLQEECEKSGRTSPSRPTLYNMEKRGIWKATSYGSNGWRKFTKEGLEKAVKAISTDILIDYSPR